MGAPPRRVTAPEALRIGSRPQSSKTVMGLRRLRGRGCPRARAAGSLALRPGPRQRSPPVGPAHHGHYSTAGAAEPPMVFPARAAATPLTAGAGASSERMCREGPSHDVVIAEPDIDAEQDHRPQRDGRGLDQLAQLDGLEHLLAALRLMAPKDGLDWLLEL